jgi:lycopene beta-cyclase
MPPMPRGRKHGLLIAGGGVAGSLTALVMARLRPDVPLLLVGEEASFGGDRDLLLLDAELGDKERERLAPVLSRSWDGFYVAFPRRGRKLALGCHLIEAGRLDEAVREALRPEQYRLGARIVAVRENGLLLHGGEELNGDGAVDARPAAPSSTLELGWRKTASRRYAFPAPHRVDLPVAADATVAQAEGCRFFSCVPLSDRRLRVEEIRYSGSRNIDAVSAAARIDDYVAMRGWKDGVVEAEEEAAARPLPLGGDFAAHWRIGGARVARLGERGGFFHPVTGCQAADGVRAALLLAQQRDFRGEALHDLFEGSAAALWKKREFYRSFNRLLMKGAGCEALERLYAAEAETVADFFGESLGLLEKRRLSAAGR